jgi:hypothetical protein
MGFLVQVCKFSQFVHLTIDLSAGRESATSGLAPPVSHMGEKVVASDIVDIAELPKTFIKRAKGLRHSIAKA